MTPRAVAGPREGALRDLIDRFTDGHPVTDRTPHGTIYSGSGTSPSISTFGEGEHRVERALPAGFADVEAWSDGYRSVWISLPLLAEVTYVEGDVSVVICPNAEAWALELWRSAEFYRPHEGYDWRHFSPGHGQVSATFAGARWRVSLTHGPDDDGAYVIDTYADNELMDTAPARLRVPGEVLG